MAYSLDEIRRQMGAGRSLSAHGRHVAAEEELAFAGAETLFEHPRKPEAGAAIELKRPPYEVDAPLTPAAVPCGQGTVARDTLGGVKAGDPVTVAEMQSRNDCLDGFFKEWVSTYYFSAAAIICGLAAIALCFVPEWGPWAAGVAAVFSGYSYAMYLWNHYWAIDYMKVRTIMIPT